MKADSTLPWGARFRKENVVPAETFGRFKLTHRGRIRLAVAAREAELGRGTKEQAEEQAKAPFLNEHGLPLSFQKPGGLVDRLGEEYARTLKSELVRLARSNKRAVIVFVKAMFARFPELRGL